MRRVYLDHAATTPLDPRVLDAMLPHLREHYGNASSVHAPGRRARFAIEEAREQVASLLGAEPAEIVFTSGGTEADNLALRGARPPGKPGLLTTAVEHEAVLRTAEALAEDGAPVTLSTPPGGALTPDALAHVLDGPGGEAIGLVAAMHANNETGTLTDLPALAGLCRERGVRLHTDAVQTAGLLPLDVDVLGVDTLALSAHKFYGPKGVGVLYVRGGVDLQPLVRGGAQERRRRGGTENVAGIVGLAAALSLAQADADATAERLTRLRARLVHHLETSLGDRFVCNTPLGAPGAAVPHVLNIAFPPRAGRPLDGEMLLLNLDVEGVYVSSGSACTSGAIEPSHVLLALGLDRPTAAAAVRFSLGKDTTDDDIDFAAEALTRVVRRMDRS